MKKFTALLLSLAMVFVLCACGTKAETDKSTDTDTKVDYSKMTIDELKGKITTLTAGTLTVATSPDFAPYEFYSIDSAGKPVLSGFDMALAQYIADYLGLKLEVIPMDFDGILAEMQNGKVDLGMAGFSPKPERANAMDFSSVYYTGGQSFVTTSANAGKIKSYTDCDSSDYSLGAQTGSIQYDLAMQDTPKADIVPMTKVTDIIQDLLAGHLDGAYIETAVAESYAKNYPDLKIVCEVPYDAVGSVVGVDKGNEALLAGVNLAIAAALSDGSMDKFIADASKLAEGDVYTGLLDNNGSVPSPAPTESTTPAPSATPAS